MPSTSGRRRAPAHDNAKPRQHSARGQRPTGGQNPANSQRPANGRRPAKGQGPSSGGRARRPDDTKSHLEQALAAAAESPQPAASFAELGLAPRLVSALAARDIRVPFAIQARALPDALAGRDVLGRAETGSGKTLAFGLPVLSRLAGLPGRARNRAPRGLILVPTRELAQQVAGVLTPLGRSLDVSVMTVYGGVPIGRQISRIAGGVDIVVATPGRLIDLLDRGACQLTDIGITVLDEADHMADLGFLPSVTRILDETPAGGQRLLFSATLDRGVDTLVRSYLVEPALHAVAPAIVAGGTAEHSVLVLDSQDKVAVAAELASRPARTLLFVRTKHAADRLARQLERAGVPAAAIHGDRNQNQRQRALNAFTAGHPRVLVATDVAARGIHVDGVELVVHFDPPKDHKDYLHRSGRTARAGASGLVVTLALREQVLQIRQLHAAAGVEPARHHVTAGHPVVREIATTGTPVPPPPPAPEARPRPADAPPRARRGPGRPPRSASRHNPASYRRRSA
jgi:superfamily II DNA/RNA helicase